MTTRLEQNTFAQPNFYAANLALTAFATGGQASATALAYEHNTISVCATAADSVKAPSAVAGRSFAVTNLGAAAAALFPQSGESLAATIAALSANASMVVDIGATVFCICRITGVWQVMVFPRQKTRQSGSGTITVATSDDYIGCTNTAGQTVNLPATANVVENDELTIKDESGTAGTNAHTVTPNGADKIEGVNASYSLNMNYGAFRFRKRGANWWMV